MPIREPLAPLELTRRLGLPIQDVAVRLDVTDRWLRTLAKLPKHRRRIVIAELELALEQMRFAASIESLLTPESLRSSGTRPRRL